MLRPARGAPCPLAHPCYTIQVREIAAVTKAVANGDLTKMVDIGASGEIRELKTTVNDMGRSHLLTSETSVLIKLSL